MAAAAPEGGEALTVIANGLAPPNPANVLDSTSPVDVYEVRRTACQLEIGGTCVVPPEIERAPTAVEVQSGSFGDIRVFDESSLAVTGGSVSAELFEDASIRLTEFDSAFVQARDRATIEVVGGSPNQQLALYDDASLAATAGSLGSISANGAASVELLGGEYRLLFLTDQAMGVLSTPSELGADSGVFLTGDASLQITDGVISDNGLLLSDRASVTMTGGGFRFSSTRTRLDDDASLLHLGGDIPHAEVFGGRLEVRGGSHDQLELQGSGSALFVGTGFAIDGTPVPLGAVSAASGQLTGTLLSGEPLDLDFSRLGTGTTLLLLPEPGLMALALATFALLHRARR